METKANYVAVGFFTLFFVLAAFGFVYWTAGWGDRAEMVPLQVRIPGSASGLNTTSPVLFNGVRVGDVQAVRIAPDDPNAAVAFTVVERSTPITRSTTAGIGIAGLTGTASLEMKGGNAEEPRLLDVAIETGEPAVITAEPSAVADLIDTAQRFMARADRVLTELEGFAQDVRPGLTETIDNANRFSQALADNADGVDEFLASVGSLAETLQTVSGRLESTLVAAEEVLNAIDGEQVRATLDNVERFTGRLDSASTNLESIMADVEQAAKSLGEVGTGATETLERIDALVASVKPEDVTATVDSIRQASADIAKVVDGLDARLDRTLEAAEGVFNAVDPDVVRSTLDNIDRFTARLDRATGNLNTVMGDVERAASSLGDLGENAGTTLERIDEVVASVNAEDVRKAVENIRRASDDIASISGNVRERGDDIDSIITSARELADRLNQASVRVDGVLAKLDGLLGTEEGESLFVEARETVASFREVAETLNARIGTITDGLARFSGPGLRDVEALVRDSRRSIARIEQAISSLERNPQRIITGGAGEVRTYDGRRRR